MEIGKGEAEISTGEIQKNSYTLSVDTVPPKPVSLMAVMRGCDSQGSAACHRQPATSQRGRLAHPHFFPRFLARLLTVRDRYYHGRALIRLRHSCSRTPLGRIACEMASSRFSFLLVRKLPGT